MFAKLNSPATIDSKTFYAGNIPVRFYVAVMIFVSCIMSYMLRTNLSINILAMVESTGNTDPTNGTALVPEQLFSSQLNATGAPPVLMTTTPAPDVRLISPDSPDH